MLMEYQYIIARFKKHLPLHDEPNAPRNRSDTAE
jgi:hypothetical protein